VAEIEVAHADAIPTPSLGLHAFTTSDPSSLVLSAGISIPLPLFDKNRGAIARAHADAERTDLELAAQRTELAATLDRASAVLATRRDAVRRFQGDALLRLGKLRAMAETSYRSGQGGIVELLDALDAITDARLRDLELRAAVAEAALDVRRAARGR
jgi:cobalt-zinc-cadmium efflux system outer membrane protein